MDIKAVCKEGAMVNIYVWEGMRGGWRKLRDESYISCYISELRATKSMRLRWEIM
jgi:hypothetical protein